MKKLTPASMAVGTGISPASFEGDDWPRKIATPPVKKMGRGGFDAHLRPGADGAGPSHGGFRLPQKHPAQTSQSPMKVSPKIQRQRAIQYQISQEDLQPQPTQLFLPSAPMGAPRAPEASQRSLNQAHAE
ncbi:MAG: hypothetical protein GY835_25020 [bacterium]|nr:hypothetical protein [bacterium]